MNIAAKGNFNMGSMEKKIMTLLFLAFCTLLFLPVSSGQCDTEGLMNKCAPDLGTFNYIKSFKLNASPKRKAKTESSYVFSKGSTYIMIVCDDSQKEGDMIISLYDKDHNLMASSYDDETKKYYPNLLFPCTSTGVYYIRASFKNTKSGCGMCILGLNKELVEL
jgi:hypothetical protein